MSPGIAFPMVMETILASTVNEMMDGMERGLNQLLARMEGEFRMNTLPMAARMEPTRQKAGCPSWMRVRIQTPTMTRAPPVMQPIFMPKRSRIQLAGTAPMGCRMANTRVNSVMITWLKPYLSSTRLLMLEKVWAGSEFTRAAIMYTARFTYRQGYSLQVLPSDSFACSASVMWRFLSNNNYIYIGLWQINGAVGSHHYNSTNQAYSLACMQLRLINNQQMGAEQPKPKQKVSLEDAIIEMKIQSKGVMRAAKKAEKESEKYKKQAKDALKKNNEDFAKLYLQSASQKRNQFLNYQRTAIKMEMMCDQVKSMEKNEKLVSSFSQMTQMVNQQMGQIDTAKLMQNMQMFNDKMDEVIINNKMTTELMQGNEVASADVEGMMDALKQEIAVEDNMKIVEGAHQSTNAQVLNPGLAKSQGNDPFLDQLKDL